MLAELIILLRTFCAHLQHLHAFRQEILGEDGKHLKNWKTFWEKIGKSMEDFMEHIENMENIEY